MVLKIQEGRPNASDLLKNKDISMMFITSTGKEVDVADGRSLRRLALACKVPIITTMAGANATVQVCTAPWHKLRWTLQHGVIPRVQQLLLSWVVLIVASIVGKLCPDQRV